METIIFVVLFGLKWLGAALLVGIAFGKCVKDDTDSQLRRKQDP